MDKICVFAILHLDTGLRIHSYTRTSSSDFLDGKRRTRRDQANDFVYSVPQGWLCPMSGVCLSSHWTSDWRCEYRGWDNDEVPLLNKRVARITVGVLRSGLIFFSFFLFFLSVSTVEVCGCWVRSVLQMLPTCETRMV